MRRNPPDRIDCVKSVHQLVCAVDPADPRTCAVDLSTIPIEQVVAPQRRLINFDDLTSSKKGICGKTGRGNVRQWTLTCFPTGLRVSL
jgi:hypothetical protein